MEKRIRNINEDALGLEEKKRRDDSKKFQRSCYQDFLWTLCGQKNSIQDGSMLTGSFTKYLCFGELMEDSGLNKRYNG